LATVQEMNLIALLFLLTSNINNVFVGLFLFVHGCLSGFFFFLIDQVQKRTHTRNLTAISGLNIYMPTLTTLV
jgi:formate hydrogenlyase subunit 3/multisubunit Na+/H+ antiporter MnhD subunit